MGIGRHFLRSLRSFVANRNTLGLREFSTIVARVRLMVLALLAFVAVSAAQTQPVLEASPSTIRLVEIEGLAEFSPAGATNWYQCHTNHLLYPGDQLRTGPLSRAVVRLTDQTVFRLGELTLMQVPPASEERAGFSLLRGVLYFFHRDRPRELRLRTPMVSAVVRGTEFNLAVAEDGATTLSMIEGEVEAANDLGRIVLRDGEQGVAEPGQAPRKTAVIEAVNVIQWCLYYPGILDLTELRLGAEARRSLADSLSAYRAGDLLAALAAYPTNRQPDSEAENLYRAALLLAVGQVDRAEALLGNQPPPTETEGTASNELRVSFALRKLVSAVKLQPVAQGWKPVLATEWLAESYAQQSQLNLEAARAAAQKAVEVSPEFAFGWSRLAELEFSFGRHKAALEALDKSIKIAPRIAEAHALKGFLLSAQNKIGPAIECFERAITLDGALGNAWLGRGLCRIHLRQAELGREDLQVAALLEPHRALLRSYLGKAYGNAGDPERATKELNLAKRIDSKDPTSWLYSALLLRQQNRINEAVDELERSMALNENRAVYRSRLLLDQDRAVRGANLAAIYQEAGLAEVSLWEASRAVSSDYANYSAHLFLANSYDRLRDPKQVNLRYETPWLSEYLVANLLAPVGAGTLSQAVSQQEYSKLFERNGLGIVSSTEYYSRGDWVQSGAQYGTLGSFAYAVDAYYRSEHGQRPNNDQEQTTVSLQLKYQITPNDGLYLQAIGYDAEGGDLAQYYDPGFANPGLRTRERQDPLLLIGYHHEWAPGVHTLVLAGHLDDTYRVSNPSQWTLALEQIDGSVDAAFPFAARQEYRSRYEAYTVEAQQVFQYARTTLILGGRYQTGEVKTESQQQIESPVFVGNSNWLRPDFFVSAPQRIAPDFERISVYGYDHLHVLDSLLAVGGMSYDRVTYPVNFRYAPLSTAKDTTDRVSPKAGFVWTPWKGTTLRAAYTRSLGGVSFDQSFRLEPAQVAGFSQAYRSIIPESIAGANAVARFETWGLSLEQHFPTRTYLGVGGELLESKVNRVFGAFTFGFPPESAEQSGTHERLRYRESSLTASVSQLVGDSWSVGTRYRLSRAELSDDFAEIATDAYTTAGFRPKQDLDALLHQVNLYAMFNHPSGFFAEGQSLWNSQSNRGYVPDLPGDDFWQFNVFAGYRFPRRWAELRLGVLNLSDQDYRLNPLNLMTELPRHRTVVVNLKFSF
jgi:tetratricopeptide (TPR) repeat protein